MAGLEGLCQGSFAADRGLFALDAPPCAVYVRRPSGPLAQLVEQLTFNQWVAGSNPARLTTEINDLARFCIVADLIE